MPSNVKQCRQTSNNTVKRQIQHNTHQAANSKADHKEKTQMSEMKNTLNVGRIEEGFVLDHIQAGKSMDIYKYLHLDKLDCCVAIIKNARSSKMGRKDIIKIECPIDYIDLDILGFIDHNITVNIIKDSRIFFNASTDNKIAIALFPEANQISNSLFNPSGRLFHLNLVKNC